MSSKPVEKSRRQYNTWVATESLEDYALRYTPASFRKWSPLLLANTALGGISFLALEAIGAVLLLNFGYTNAIWSIALASLIILLAGIPISYYAARYNIDIDLLTRSAGFGYVGSTITSLVYASFCFIFFALEAAIMAQALKLCFGLPVSLGYLLCSLIIIPIVFYGVTAINRLHQWTQPFWLILMLLPFYFVLTRDPSAIEFLTHYPGGLSGNNTFDPYYFGIATGISFSLIAQIGEQVDYLRFMPDKHEGNRYVWWFSVLLAGPGWIVLGAIKQIGGMLLASVVVLSGLAIAQAKEPVQMYYTAYTFVFGHPGWALAVSTLFVVISQIKINVTNAYAGSLAWSNFFSRVTHAHPGRVVWLVFNIVIALILMELGVFDAIQNVLGLYSNVAIAWIAAVVADLTINKPLGLSPPIIEFKRAHLYDYNPVGFVSMLVASVVSIIAFTGVFGLYAQAYSWLIALTLSFVLSPVIAKLTKGKYYIARQNIHFINSDELCTCGICNQQYAQTDFAYCPFHEVSICSLCCTLESACKDQCKPPRKRIAKMKIMGFLSLISMNKLTGQMAARLAQFMLLFSAIMGVVALTFWLIYSLSVDASNLSHALEIKLILSKLFIPLAILIAIASWGVILVQESRELAEGELSARNEDLIKEIATRKLSEQYEQFRSYILDLLFTDRSLQKITECIVLGIEQQNPEMLCSILMLDETGKHLGRAVAPSLPDFYNAALEGVEIGVGVGSCGTAAFTGERVIVEEIATHPYWAPYKELAAQANLGSCWSQPFRASSDKILGTFAIYHHEAHTPSTFDIVIIENTAQLVRLTIERHEARNKIENLAFYDTLTGLANRRMLVDRLQQSRVSSARSAKQCALLFIDLDHFKDINDIMGHDVGDQLLKQVAQRLTTCMREGDTVARLGGDEFVVMLEELSENKVETASQARIIGEKILSLLRRPYMLAGQAHLNTPSIGATLFYGLQQSADELLKQADIAMYEVKQSGRNALRFFDPQMQKVIEERVAFEIELRNAISQQQFQLHYQIQVDSSQRPVGAEALIRWVHPERGMIPPVKFIPLAEESGLIISIGQWVLDTACAQIHDWQQNKRSRDLVLAVNVSAPQLRDVNFVNQVQAAVRRHAINPKLLKLELTESMLIDNVEVTIDMMNQLKLIGIQLSLDDFGTGYSSLQYLKLLPLDQLKIDQSFVRDLETDSHDRSIVRTIIAMAQGLDLDVIAEGVENEAQFNRLLSKGCTRFQGYLFCKPMPIILFNAFLDDLT
ncbi:MAG: EAL domain-containing protein [Gallionella sp.]